jgi:hypothetical protein
MPATTRSPLSWTPVLRGDIYCAPACGGKCTLAQHRAVTKAATTVARRLGRGWRPEVWENLGWFGAAVTKCGRLKVHLKDHGRFVAFLGPRESVGGDFVGTGDTPEAAILDVLARGRAALATLTDILAVTDDANIPLSARKR